MPGSWRAEIESFLCSVSRGPVVGKRMTVIGRSSAIEARCSRCSGSDSRGGGKSVAELEESGAEHTYCRPHSVPLNQAALDVLEKRKGDHPMHVLTHEGNPILQVNTKAWR